MSKVKIVQIVTLPESDGSYPQVIGLDNNGQVWTIPITVGGGGWRMLELPEEPA